MDKKVVVIIYSEDLPPVSAIITEEQEKRILYILSEKHLRLPQ